VNALDDGILGVELYHTHFIDLYNNQSIIMIEQVINLQNLAIGT
jgi:hypothetical protein